MTEEQLNLPNIPVGEATEIESIPLELEELINSKFTAEGHADYPWFRPLMIESFNLGAALSKEENDLVAQAFEGIADKEAQIAGMGAVFLIMRALVLQEGMGDEPLVIDVDLDLPEILAFQERTTFTKTFVAPNIARYTMVRN